ncbi:MAG TPA: GatB/YqeY domain-containing protein [Azospirillaceae bacterium]|nr:GatB/YqeY domain-containing protein [Azospirillaceae bacterium]
MLRQRLNEALKEAMKAKEQRAVSTVRLILAALKDRDIAARGKGNMDGIGEDEILSMFQTMIKQRQEAIALYEQGGRQELAQQEREEIAVIERFMPKQMTEDEVRAAIGGLIAELGATSIKDMGKVMAEMRSRYAGRMDSAKASGWVKEALAP